MPVYSNLLFAVTAIGAFNALLLALLWFDSGRRHLLRGYWPYPALAFLGGVVMVLIGAEHAGLGGSLSGLEWALTALSGALVFDAVSRSAGRRAGALPYAIAAAGFVLAVFVLPRFGIVPIHALVALQWCFTLASFLVWRGAGGHRQTRRAAGTLIAIFILLHLAQAARMAWPEVFRDLIPIGLAVAFAALTGVLLFRSRSLNTWFRLADRTEDDAAETAIARIETWLAEAHRYRDPQLRLADAAAAAQVRPDDLSRWLNERGRTFPEFLSDVRLNAAAALLRDPGEARTSIEAIGLMCGFSSRSGFYKAFAKRFDMTPAAYRKAVRG